MYLKNVYLNRYLITRKSYDIDDIAEFAEKPTKFQDF